jgi:hypothetical protein
MRRYEFGHMQKGLTTRVDARISPHVGGCHEGVLPPPSAGL